MKKTIYTIVVILILHFTLHIENCLGQWVQMSNGIGNNKSVSSFVVNGSNLFAGTYGLGVFISTNNGTSWTQTGLTNQYIYSLAVSGNNIFAGTLSYGVFISTNNGTNWTQTALNNKWVYAFVVIGNNIFAGTHGSGVYFSTNNGANWTQTALNNKTVSALALSGNNLFAGTVNHGVYISTNNGVSWTQTPLNNKTVSALALSGNNIFAGTHGSGVYLSTNNGSNWTQTALNNKTVYSFAILWNTIFAGTGSGVYLTIDNCTSWSQINRGFNPPVPSVYTLLIPNNYMFAGTHSNSVWRIDLSVPPITPVLISPANYSTENLLNLNLVWSKSQSANVYNVVLATDSTFTNIVLNDSLLTDTTKALTNLFPVTNYYWKVRTKNIAVWGQFSPYYKFKTCSPWYPMYSGITNTNVNSFTVNGTNIYTGTMGGVFLSTNNGGNWTAINNGLTNLNVKALISNGSNLFAGTEGGGVFLSTNNGGFWMAVNSGLYSQSIRSFIVSGNNIFAGTSGGVYRSSNNGGNWISAGLSYTDINYLLLNGSTIYAGTSGGLYYTYNNGSNWNGTFGTMNVNTIAISGTNLYIGTPTGVFLSTNNGTTWANNWLSNQNVNALIINGIMLFAGTESGGIFLSANNGINWFEKNQGFNTTPSVRSFLIYNNFIFAGTYGQKVWNRDLSYIIGIKTISNFVPSKYLLQQNYPNPFNPTTNIKFDIPKNAFVTMKVFDMLGREVAILVNEQLKPGTFEVDWDGSSYASGVYFYKLMTSDYVETKKMVLIK